MTDITIKKVDGPPPGGVHRGRPPGPAGPAIEAMEIGDWLCITGVSRSAVASKGYKLRLRKYTVSARPDGIYVGRLS